MLDEHVGKLVLALRPEAGDDLRPGSRPAGELVADGALEDDVGRLAQQLGAEDREVDADHGEQDDQR